MAEFRHIVRVSGTDLRGELQIQLALTGIKGVGQMMARSISILAGCNPIDKMGDITDEQVKNLERILESPLDNGIPTWMLNRRKDMETGSDLHVTGSKLAISFREDINNMRKMRAYRGIRHELGLPARGQRTKSSFRTGSSIGVRRKKRSEK